MESFELNVHFNPLNFYIHCVWENTVEVQIKYFLPSMFRHGGGVTFTSFKLLFTRRRQLLK